MSCSHSQLHYNESIYCFIRQNFSFHFKIYHRNIFRDSFDLFQMILFKNVSGLMENCLESFPFYTEKRLNFSLETSKKFSNQSFIIGITLTRSSLLLTVTHHRYQLYRENKLKFKQIKLSEYDGVILHTHFKSKLEQISDFMFRNRTIHKIHFQKVCN